MKKMKPMISKMRIFKRISDLPDKRQGGYMAQDEHRVKRRFANVVGKLSKDNPKGSGNIVVKSETGEEISALTNTTSPYISMCTSIRNGTELSEITDIETENLFVEMNYCMEVGNVGGSDSIMVDSVENIMSNTNMDLTCDCLGGGDHHIILDEQIGLRCTVCHLVMKEINNILPNFYKHQGGRSQAREEFYNMDYCNFNTIPIEEFTATNLSSLKHNVPVEGTVWNLVPGIMNGMYIHQIEGFEFIWKNIAGSIFVEKAKKFISDGVGSGCIISHAPGTGKTRLTIMFLKTYIQLNPDCRPLIIAPCSMLLSWEEEFQKWNIGIPFHNLNSTEYSGQESKLAVNLQKKNWRKGWDLDFTRLVKFSWKTEKSVLGISYQLFEELGNISVLFDRGIKEGKRQTKDNDTAGQIRKMLLLLPGLLVLDEGHIPRNRASQIWTALSDVQTKRRIMLSGTPFQNNFEELLNALLKIIICFGFNISLYVCLSYNS